MSSAPKYKRDDYVALCRSKTIPDHYMLFLNCVFQINDCIKDEDSYNYVLSIVEGASDEEINKMKVVIPERYLSLLKKTQIYGKLYISVGKLYEY